MPRHRVPVAVKVRAAHILRQAFKRAQVFRIRAQKYFVIVYACGYKGVILRPLAVLHPPVYKQPLHPAVPNVARVACVIHPRLKVLSRGAVACGQKTHLLLGKMRGLLHAYNVVFLTLVLIYVVRPVAIAKLQSAAVWEAEHALRGVICRGVAKLFEQRYNVVLSQLRQRAPEQQAIKPLIA